MPWPLYPKGQRPWYSLDRVLCMSQCWPGDSKGEGKVVPVLSTTPSRFIHCLVKHHAMKMHWENGGIAPCILNHGIGWKWVLSFTPWLLYSLVLKRKFLPLQVIKPRLSGLWRALRYPSSSTHKSTVKQFEIHVWNTFFCNRRKCFWVCRVCSS
jgi:hypothetical protein